MLFPSQKYLPRLAESHPLIRGQSLYCQSSLPSKYFCLNDGYRYLQLLLPPCTYHNYIFACFFQEIKPGGGEAGQTKTIQKEEVMLQKKWGQVFTGHYKSPCGHQQKWDCENCLFEDFPLKFGIDI